MLSESKFNNGRSSILVVLALLTAALALPAAALAQDRRYADDLVQLRQRIEAEQRGLPASRRLNAGASADLRRELVQISRELGDISQGLRGDSKDQADVVRSQVDDLVLQLSFTGSMNRARTQSVRTSLEDISRELRNLELQVSTQSRPDNRGRRWPGRPDTTRSNQHMAWAQPYLEAVAADRLRPSDGVEWLMGQVRSSDYATTDMASLGRYLRRGLPDSARDSIGTLRYRVLLTTREYDIPDPRVDIAGFSHALDRAYSLYQHGTDFTIDLS
jgi:hypothetical protein